MVKYVGQHIDRSPEGGRNILVRRVIDLNAVTAQALKHLEPTAIQDRLTIKPMEVLAVYPSPSRPLIA